jgi:hypothetical protein
MQDAWRLPAQPKRRSKQCHPVLRKHQTPARTQREQHLRALADQLLFTIDKKGKRFTLSRTADVSRPVKREGLSLDEAEELLATWKLRGLQGG